MERHKKLSPNSKYDTKYQSVPIREYRYVCLNGAIFGYWITFKKHPVTWENDYSSPIQQSTEFKEYYDRIRELVLSPLEKYSTLLDSYYYEYYDLVDNKGYESSNL